MTTTEIRSALGSHPGATTIDLAESLGLGRSTVTAALARMEREGVAVRTPGGRDGSRRLPDVWALAPRVESGPGSLAFLVKPPSSLLRPGQLRTLVAEFLSEQDAPVTPGQVARHLNRSAGAVTNALARMAAEGQAALVSSSPRRYRRS
jgi:DNA-binding MarR family transcriptional regulator